jgi:hypothetical protein
MKIPLNNHYNNITGQTCEKHPAECGKIIRPEEKADEAPWGAVGTIFDVFCSSYSDFKLITINGRTAVFSEPADWQTIIVTGRQVRRSEICNEPAIRRQSTSNY